jgi:hypothetical protein
MWNGSLVTAKSAAHNDAMAAAVIVRLHRRLAQAGIDRSPIRPIMAADPGLSTDAARRPDQQPRAADAAGWVIRR